MDWAYFLAFPEILLIAAVVVGIIVVMIVSYAATLLRNWRAPRRVVRAVLVRKSTRMYGYDFPWSSPGVLWRIIKRPRRPPDQACLISVRWLTFRVGEREVEFAVPERVYAALPEGCVGALTFKGERFVDFKPLRPGG